MKYVVGIFLAFVSMISVSVAQEYILFYGNGCPHCAKVEEYFKDNAITKTFDVQMKEIYFNKNNLKELQEYLYKLHLDANQIGVPFLVVNNKNECSYINGSASIIDFFQKKIDMIAASSDENLECNVENCQGLQCESQTLEGAKDTTNGTVWLGASKQDSSTSGNYLSGETQLSGVVVSSEKSSSTLSTWKFLGIMMPAALSDSINPCAFAVMLLLLSTILSRHQSRRKTLLAGGLFVLAVFLSYLAMGVGLFSALASANNTFILKVFVGSLGVLVGLANLKDYFRYGKFFVMEVPFSWRSKLQDIIHKVSSPLGAFVVGILVSLFLLPCSSGPYFTILGYMSSQTKELNFLGYMYLVIYNLIFVLPMLVIAILVSFGWASIDKLAKFKHEKTKLIHLIVGILMLGLGAYVLITI